MSGSKGACALSDTSPSEDELVCEDREEPDRLLDEVREEHEDADKLLEEARDDREVEDLDESKLGVDDPEEQEPLEYPSSSSSDSLEEESSEA